MFKNLLRKFYYTDDVNQWLIKFLASIVLLILSFIFIRKRVIIWIPLAFSLNIFFRQIELFVIKDDVMENENKSEIDIKKEKEFTSVYIYYTMYLYTQIYKIWLCF